MTERFSPTIVDVVVPANRKEGRPRDARGHLVIPEPGTPGVITLLGIGHDGRLPRWTAEKAEGRTDVASSTPFPDIPADVDAVRSLARRYPEAVHDAWREVHEDDELTAHVIADSQAGVGLAMAVANSPHLWDNVAYLRMLGASSEQMGDTPEARLKTFGRRALTSLTQEDQRFTTDIVNGYVALRVLGNLRPATLGQMKIGLSENTMPFFLDSAKERFDKGLRTGLVTGEFDELFLRSEHEKLARDVNESLGFAAIDLIVLEGATHRSPATERGAPDLAKAIDYVSQAA